MVLVKNNMGEIATLGNNSKILEVNVRELFEKKKKGTLKLFCGIPFKVRDNALDKIDTILNTWGQNCDGIGFFVDRGTKYKFDLKHQPYIYEIDMKRLSGDGKGLDNRPSKHILERVILMHRFVSENFIDEYDIFSKIDCDSIVLTQNLKEFVRKKGWDMDDDHYFGHVLHHVDPALVSGPATFFSRGALIKLGRRLQNIPVEIGDRRNFAHNRCIDRDGATVSVKNHSIYSLGVIELTIVCFAGREDNFPLFKGRGYSG